MRKAYTLIAQNIVSMISKENIKTFSPKENNFQTIFLIQFVTQKYNSNIKYSYVFNFSSLIKRHRTYCTPIGENE